MFKYKKCLSILDGTQHSSVSSSEQCIIPDPSKALECKFRSSLVDFFWVWLWGLFSRILWVEVVQSGLLLLLFKTKPDLKTSRCMSMFVMKSIWFKNPEGLYFYLGRCRGLLHESYHSLSHLSSSSQTKRKHESKPTPPSAPQEL